MLLNDNLLLRQAGAADWPAVEALLRANKLPTEGARQQLPTSLLTVSKGEVVGCAAAEIHGDIALLRSVAVAPGRQRQGIGQMLVERLMLEAARRRISRLCLLTVTAPEFFARFGFKRMKIEDAPEPLKASAGFPGAGPACVAFLSLTLVETRAPRRDLPVAVIGAGPVGLAAVARLIERGIEPLLLEAGDGVGTSLRDDGHVPLFSPWRHNVDAATAAQLETSGWTAPNADDLPLAGEIVDRDSRNVITGIAGLQGLSSMVGWPLSAGLTTDKGTLPLVHRGRGGLPRLLALRQPGAQRSCRARHGADRAQAAADRRHRRPPPPDDARTRGLGRGAFPRAANAPAGSRWHRRSGKTVGRPTANAEVDGSTGFTGLPRMPGLQ